ncbi:hypothetical protein [Methanopyrus kandleri]
MRALKELVKSERGQGGIEYLLLIAALIGLGILIAYYWWTSAQAAGKSASGGASTAGSTAKSKGTEMASTYASKIS